MTEHARDELIARLKALLSSGDYSDLTITCGSDIYKVHKAVVCLQSSFFKKAEKFPVGKEAAEGKVDLPEDDPHAVKLLVRYFYESEYGPELPKIGRFDEAGRVMVTAPKKNGYHYMFPHTCTPGCPTPNYQVCHHHSCDDNSCRDKCVNFICKECTKSPPPEGDAAQLLLHATMYEVADKYDVAGLRSLAQEKFCRSCEAFWDSEHLATAAEHALNTTPDSDTGLREVLCQTIVSHIELLNKPVVADLLKKHTGFAFDVLRRLAVEKAGLKPSS